MSALLANPIGANWALVGGGQRSHLMAMTIIAMTNPKNATNTENFFALLEGATELEIATARAALVEAAREVAHPIADWAVAFDDAKASRGR